jgi:hypothetical protein
MNIDLIDIDLASDTQCIVDGTVYAKSACSVAPFGTLHVQMTCGSDVYLVSLGSKVNGFVPRSQTALITAINNLLSGNVSWGDLPVFYASRYASIQAAVNAARSSGGGTVVLPMGTTTVTSTIDLFQGAAINLRIVGAARGASTISTSSDIEVFRHAEFCVFEDFSVIQTGAAKTGRAFATPTNKQASRCTYERLYVEGFKQGIWWRYSLWCSVADVFFKNCGIGIKASRNASPDDQTDPVAPGGWNLDPGFFHNMNMFSNVICDGGEAGIWGAFHGAVFSGVTCQNQLGDGSTNTVIPSGVHGTGLMLQSGSGSSTFGSGANNIVGLYTEFTRQPLVVDFAQTILGAVYFQGGAIGTPYEQLVKVNGGIVNFQSGVPRVSDYWKHRIVLSSSSSFNGQIDTGPFTVAAQSVDETSNYFPRNPAGVNFRFNVTGAATHNIGTMTSRRAYSVYVTGLYNGATAKGAKFDVFYWQSGIVTILTATGSSADITCSASGTTLQLSQANAFLYNLYVTVVEHEDFGNSLP